MKRNLIPENVVDGKCNYCMDMTTPDELTVPVVYVGYVGICQQCINIISHVFNEHIKHITKGGK